MAVSAPPRQAQVPIVEIAAAIVLALSFVVPAHCNLSANGATYATDDGGPLFGAVTIALVVVALYLRRRAPFSPRTLAALALAALGAVQLTRGALSLARVPDADLTPAVREFFAHFKAGDTRAIFADAPARAADGERTLEPLARGFARGRGAWTGGVSITDIDRGEGLARTSGVAIFERGTVHFELGFRIDAGPPRLETFELSIPEAERPAAGDAVKAARGFVDHVVAGDLDRVHADFDPRVDVPASFDAVVTNVHRLTGGSADTTVRSQITCELRGQCFEMAIHTSKGDLPVHLEINEVFGTWLVDRVTLGKD